jgi:hypothetical protein
MQLGVDGDGDRADPPDAIEAFQILRAIGCEQSDPIAGRDRILARQSRADGSRTPRERRIVRVEIEAGEQCRSLGAQTRGRGEPFGDVHRLHPRVA